MKNTSQWKLLALLSLIKFLHDYFGLMNKNIHIHIHIQNIHNKERRSIESNKLHTT